MQNIKTEEKIEKIKINKKLLNKYEGFTDIIKKQKLKTDFIKVKYAISKNLADMKLSDIKKFAIDIFDKTHNKRIFRNKKNYIIVSNAGINESVEKIYNNYSQREMLIEHLMVFSRLGEIIEHAKLVNQVPERKGREKYISWNYYVDGILIKNKNYILEFEVVSMKNNENHYRVQRLVCLTN